MSNNNFHNTNTVSMEDIIRGVQNELAMQNMDEREKAEYKAEIKAKTYRHIAGALASRYEVIYYIDINNNSYTQYSASDEYAQLGTSRHGDDFFKDAVTDIEKFIHPDDKKLVLSELEKEHLIKHLEEDGSLSLTYRQLLGNSSRFVNTTIVHPKNDPDHIIMGVLNIDAQIKREQAMLEESRIYSEISASLAARYEVIYHVNILTNEYAEYSSSEKYTRLEVGTKGADFFTDTHNNMQRDIYPEDLPMMNALMEKDTLLKRLDEDGKVFVTYRLILDGRPQYVTLFVVRPKKDSNHIIVAVENIDELKRKEQEFERAIGSAMDMANKDALTGVKNKHAYVNAEILLDAQIESQQCEPFAIAVCDINGLKQVNDANGHSYGDDYIKSACSLICNTFKHSPVFRVGGDEFVVILKGTDYDSRAELIALFGMKMAENKDNNLVTLAYGISDYLPGKDLRVQDVFERADSLMYTNKKWFKGEIADPGMPPSTVSDSSIRFYRLYEQLVSAMTEIGEVNVQRIEELLIEISTMFRLSKGVTRLYRNPQEERMGGGETLSCFDTGKEGKEIISLRVVTSVMSIATITVYMSPDEKPLTEEERWKVELVMRTTLSFVSRNRLRDIVEELAYFDEEGYPNLRTFGTYIMKNAGSGKISGMAVFHYNLRHFSVINHEFGRKTGDVVMKNHFNTLKSLLAEDEILVRLGGDNFIGITSMSRLKEVLAFLTESVIPIDEEKSVRISCSVGVFCVPKEYPVRAPSDVLGQIISALKVAQSGKKESIVYFDDSLFMKGEQNKKILKQFPEALAAGEFKPFYQPKVNVLSGSIVGAEALCRWFHDGRMISPGDFIPVLEETSDICKLDLHMLDCVCRDFRRWLDDGLPVVRVSVNFSGKNILNAGLVGAITEIVDHYEIPHSYIEIELTETTTDVAFSDLKRIAGGLHKLGFWTAVDDFGVGFSSLNLIHQIPWNVLKIDRSFLPVSEDSSEHYRAVMFRHVVSMARQLGMECIAEGVETDEQLEILRKNNCDLAQGFYFDKPMPVDAFEKCLIEGMYEV